MLAPATIPHRDSADALTLVIAAISSISIEMYFFIFFFVLDSGPNWVISENFLQIYNISLLWAKIFCPFCH